MSRRKRRQMKRKTSATSPNTSRYVREMRRRRNEERYRDGEQDM